MCLYKTSDIHPNIFSDNTDLKERRLTHFRKFKIYFISTLHFLPLVDLYYINTFLPHITKKKGIFCFLFSILQSRMNTEPELNPTSSHTCQISNCTYKYAQFFFAVCYSITLYKKKSILVNVFLKHLVVYVPI
jgi:hypothetical protein